MGDLGRGARGDGKGAEGVEPDFAGKDDIVGDKGEKAVDELPPYPEGELEVFRDGIGKDGL